MKKLFHWLKVPTTQLKINTYALYLACKDRRVPWYAKLLAGLVVGYALSPIDLIPDFIPVLGYLDDLLLIPLGVRLVFKLVPKDVMAEHQEHAKQMLDQDISKRSWVGGMVILGIWILIITWLAITLWRAFKE